MKQMTSAALFLGMTALGSCDAPCTITTTDIISSTSTTCISSSVEYSASTQSSASRIIYTSPSAAYLSSKQAPTPNNTTTCASTAVTSDPTVTASCTSTTNGSTTILTGLSKPGDTSPLSHYSSESKTPCRESTADHLPPAPDCSVGPTASACNTLPPYPLSNSSATCTDAVAGTATHLPVAPVGPTHPYSSLFPPYPLANHTSIYANATAPAGNGTAPAGNGTAPCEETGVPLGEIEVDADGKPMPTRFGMHALLSLFDDLPFAPWRWPELPERGNPITRSPDEFKDTTCTGEFIDSYEEERASRHLHHFCNRWQVESERLYASTSSKTTIFMCSWGGVQNCSLALWEAASAHLDKECGIGGTGYVSLQKLRLGRERPSEHITFCDRLTWSPLFDYRINQREVLVDGMPYEEWRILNRRKQAKKDYGPKDINEGHDAPP
ncbi:hypothetical protein PWT90_10955 [Aphanocladium album]|nr:hypothetical protein PWT90_10955 [Aphanocladium album]